MKDFQIIELSPERWREYKNLRIEAVQSDPQAFGQTYKKIIGFPDSYWIDHLQNTLKKDKTLVYFAESDGRLIGMNGVFFPLKDNPDYAQMFGVYVNSHFRGLGIAKELQVRVLSEAKRIKKIKKIKVMVNKEQIAAVRLYNQGDFKLVRTSIETLGDGGKYEVATLEQDLS